MSSFLEDDDPTTELLLHENFHDFAEENNFNNLKNYRKFKKLPIQHFQNLHESEVESSYVIKIF